MSSKTSQSSSLEDKRARTDYRELFQKLPYPYLIFDAQDSEYRVVDVNEARARFSGVSREDLIGRPWFDVLADLAGQRGMTGIPAMKRQMQHMLRTGQLEDIPILRGETVEPNGKLRVRYWQADCVFIRDSSEQITCVVVTTRDVTEERRVARRASRTEDRLEAALSIGKIGSWMWDVRSDQVVPDKNFVKLFKLPEQRVRELKMQDVFESVHPDDRARVKRAIRRSVVERIPFEEENRIILQNGEPRWVLARGQAEEADGDVTVTGVVVDITERHSLQAEIALARRQEKLNRRVAKMLRERNEELEAISRSKDEFVALASHQLRTPATAVKQYLGMVLQGYAGDISAIQSDMLHKAFESNERQIEVINQILNAARADTGRLTIAPMAHDLGALVWNIMSEMRPMFEQHEHQVNLRLPRLPVTVTVDQGYMRMAIENVLNNACDYTPNGGTITVQLSRASKNCLLTIADTGVGIRKSDYGKLFAKFSRIHNSLSVQAGGSGIGLYLTAEIVRLHHGKITVESKLHKGTTFAISLPLVQNTK